jgi:Fe-S-cluster containining protein
MVESRRPLARLEFPEDEKRQPWLSALLEAYAVMDEGVSIAIAGGENRSGKRLACRKGCDSCCRTQTDIPVYPLELVGLYWFCNEKIEGPEREVLRERLEGHCSGMPCPFLIDGACSIHPMRPLACRQFNVLGSQCAEGEDPFFTRREDVLDPVEEFTHRAFFIMLPFYGVTDEAMRRHVIKNGLIHAQAANLKSFDWKRLAGIMDGAQTENP